MGAFQLNTNQLHSFIEVAKSCSINKASSKLMISRQSLCAQIKSLENELQTSLFVRTNKGVTLTPSGKVVFQSALEIVSKIQFMRKAILEMEESSLLIDKKGHLNIMSVPMVSHYLLPSAAKQFMLAYPHVSLKLQESSSEDVIASVEDQSVDLGFLFLTPSEYEALVSRPGLTFEKVFSTVICASVSYDHSLAKYSSIPLKLFAQYPLSIYKRMEIERLRKLIKPYGEPIIHTISDNYSIVEEVISSGLAVGVTTKQMAYNKMLYQSNDRLRIIPLKGAPNLTVYSVQGKHLKKESGHLAALFKAITEEIV